MKHTLPPPNPSPQRPNPQMFLLPPPRNTPSHPAKCPATIISHQPGTQLLVPASAGSGSNAADLMKISAAALPALK